MMERLMSWPCEHSNEPSGFIKGGVLSDYWLLNKDSALWRCGLS